MFYFIFITLNEQRSRDTAGTHIADLVLRFLDSLQLWRVCDHAETFSFILLKVLPVVDLHSKQDQVKG